MSKRPTIAGLRTIIQELHGAIQERDAIYEAYRLARNKAPTYTIRCGSPESDAGQLEVEFAGVHRARGGVYLSVDGSDVVPEFLDEAMAKWRGRGGNWPDMVWAVMRVRTSLLASYELFSATPNGVRDVTWRGIGVDLLEANEGMSLADLPRSAGNEQPFGGGAAPLVILRRIS